MITNEYYDDGECTYLTVNNGEIRYYMDTSDVPRMNFIHWYPDYYGYLTTKINGKNVKFHRYLLGLTNPKEIVDHIDRDVTNNRRSNLRIVTHQENMRNRNKDCTNTSGYIGVSEDKSGRRKKRWRAFITGKTLGYFYTREEAYDARRKAEKEIYGDK